MNKKFIKGYKFKMEINRYTLLFEFLLIIVCPLLFIASFTIPLCYNLHPVIAWLIFIGGIAMLILLGYFLYGFYFTYVTPYVIEEE